MSNENLFVERSADQITALTVCAFSVAATNAHRVTLYKESHRTLRKRVLLEEACS